MTFSVADWNAKMLARHEEEVAAGKHDAECEYGSRMVKPTGFVQRREGAAEVRAFLHMCHCAKRARIAKGETTPPGALIITHPSCPRCYREVDFDGDSWVCTTCHVQWGTTNEDDEGTFNDDYGDLGRPVTAADTKEEAPA